jgi:hypothetical protein
VSNDTHSLSWPYLTCDFSSYLALANDGDGKNDSFESLPPLERARRRKQLMMRG